MLKGHNGKGTKKDFSAPPARGLVRLQDVRKIKEIGKKWCSWYGKNKQAAKFLRTVVSRHRVRRAGERKKTEVVVKRQKKLPLKRDGLGGKRKKLAIRESEKIKGIAAISRRWQVKDRRKKQSTKNVL